MVIQVRPQYPSRDAGAGPSRARVWPRSLRRRARRETTDGRPAKPDLSVVVYAAWRASLGQVKDAAADY